MKLTKREKTLLQILCGTLIVFVYFLFLIEPQWKKLKELKDTRDAYNRSIEAVEISLASKDLVEKEIAVMQEEIADLKMAYFDSIDQGNMILLLDEWIEALLVPYYKSFLILQIFPH